MRDVWKLSPEEVAQVEVCKLDLAINLKGFLYSFDFAVDRDLLMKKIWTDFLQHYHMTNRVEDAHGEKSYSYISEQNEKVSLSKGDNMLNSCF